MWMNSVFHCSFCGGGGYCAMLRRLFTPIRQVPQILVFLSKRNSHVDYHFSCVIFLGYVWNCCHNTCLVSHNLSISSSTRRQPMSLCTVLHDSWMPHCRLISIIDSSLAPAGCVRSNFRVFFKLLPRCTESFLWRQTDIRIWIDWPTPYVCMCRCVKYMNLNGNFLFQKSKAMRELSP